VNGGASGVTGGDSGVNGGGSDGTAEAAAAAEGARLGLTPSGWPLLDIRLFETVVHESTILSPPPAHLHCLPWCNTIARLLDSIRLAFRPPVCMLYIIQYW